MLMLCSTLLLRSATMTNYHEIDSFQQYKLFPQSSGAKRTGIKVLTPKISRLAPPCLCQLPIILGYNLQSLSLDVYPATHAYSVGMLFSLLGVQAISHESAGFS